MSKSGHDFSVGDHVVYPTLVPGQEVSTLTKQWLIAGDVHVHDTPACSTAGDESRKAEAALMSYRDGSHEDVFEIVLNSRPGRHV